MFGFKRIPKTGQTKIMESITDEQIKKYKKERSQQEKEEDEKTLIELREKLGKVV